MPLRSAPFIDPAAAERLKTTVCAQLAQFFSFGSCAHYFSRSGPMAPEWLPGENRLLLPLLANGDATLVLRLDSVCGDLVPILPFLPQLLRICLENAELAARLDRDSATGLHDEAALLAETAARIEALAEGSRPGSFGLLTFVWAARPEPGPGIDAVAIDLAAAELAETFRRRLPHGAYGAAIGALSGFFGFALLVDVSARSMCQRLAVDMIAAFAAVPSSESLAGKTGGFYAGHAMYPGDISGRDLFRTAQGKALLLRDRALLSGRLAWQNGEQAMAFGWIPSSGCVVEEHRGHGILRISPGHAANIRVGQRFNVYAGNGASKAQIIVRESREHDALCEILHVASAMSQPGPGDRLGIEHGGQHLDSSATGLPDRSWFFRRFEELARRSSQFCLAITRLEQAGAAEPFESAYAGFVRKALADPLDGVLTGRYGSDGIVTFVPGDRTDSAMYRRLHECARACGLVAITGIFAWPCLNIGKDAAEEGALKALEYAALLQEPHIGFLDGLALAISGDKLFSQGEELAALEEYRLALLLRPDDAAILNALGVCLASLHRPGEARARFIEAVSKCSDSGLKAKICYNLGNLAQKEEDLASARAHYRACIRLDPDHVYAWARFAQITNLAGKPKSSISLYRHAARLAEAMPEALGMIERQLARVEAGRSETGRAREILHDSLLRNPQDQASLLELARTYIDDDPAMAELLARKCANLGSQAADVLIDALVAQGRTEEAARLSGRRA